MATLKKIILSGSTDGRNIKVVATATPGTLIHTAVNSVVEGEGDQIMLWAHNSHSAEVTLTLECGGVTAPDDLIAIPLPAGAHHFLLPSRLLRNAVVLRAFASVANVVMVYGEVNRSN